MANIAGHNFDAGPLGNHCSNTRYTDGVAHPCGRNLVDILCASRDDIGKEGFACSGTLTETEYNQIEAERERIWKAMEHQPIR